jgi:glyoxylase-like metal-dependent hydrolase (beta-lactamase superfamily II)/rhodanese-related sulfurtransferase
MSSDYPDPVTDVSAVSPAALHDRLRAGERITLLDVRDRDEFDEWHIDGATVEAHHVPYIKFVQAQVKGGIADLVADLAEPITVVCGRGEASAYVASLLAEEGIEARNLTGGMDEWARLAVTEPFGVQPGGTVVQYQRPSSGCLSYLVVSGGEAAVIDPLRAFADRYVADAAERDAEVKYVVDTHVHADHVSGLRAVADATDARPLLPKGAKKRGLTYADEYGATLVEDGDEFRVGDLILTAVALPGHTTETVGYHLGEVLFAGDTVFRTSVARPDLEAGDAGAEDHARQLSRTIRDEVLPLPDRTRICPAHYSTEEDPAADGTYTVTVGEVEERLGELVADEEAFVEFVLRDMPPRPANYEEIIATNLGKRETDPETAFELELGPNNCAATSMAD